MDSEAIVNVLPARLRQINWERHVPHLLAELGALPPGRAVSGRAIADALGMSVHFLRQVRREGKFPQPDIRGVHNSVWWNAQALAVALRRLYPQGG